MKNIVFLSALLFVFSCSNYKPEVPGFFYDDGYYKNHNIGFKLLPPPDWTVGTTPKTAPEDFKGIFKDQLTESSELLFAGANPRNRAFVRCLTDAYDTTLKAYFKETYHINEEALETIKAERISSGENEIIVWSYDIKESGTNFRFKEYIFGQGILKVRLGFWTLASLFGDYEELFDKVAETIILADTTDDTTKIWQSKPIFSRNSEENKAEIIEFATNKKELYFGSQKKEDLCQGSNESFLWKISSENDTGYIFGSVHILKPEMYPLKNVIESSFAKSTHLALEVNTNSPANKEKLGKIAESGTYQNGKTIKDDISPELYKKMADWLKKHGLPVKNFETFKPWMCAMVLQQIQMQMMGLSPEFGIETYFTNKVENQEIIELENAEDQIAMLQNLDGESFLSYTLLGMNRMEEDMNSMLQAWRCGNEKHIEQMLFNTVPPMAKDFYEKMFYSRNKKMAQGVLGLLENGNTPFVVVGAGHLVGEQSILKILQASGIQVEQL